VPTTAVAQAKHEIDRAIADYDQVIRLQPNYAAALYWRGMAKRFKAGDAGGDADIAAAKKLNPNIGRWCRTSLYRRRSCWVLFWHEPDHQRCPQFGRYRGESGHGAHSPIRSRMTPSGHWAPLKRAMPKVGPGKFLGDSILRQIKRGR
jgi:hypothetical protein